MEVKPIKKVSTAAKVFETLYEMIASGKIQRGQKLPSQEELARKFGVSRNTLREAMNKLYAMGLLSSHQGIGTVVESPNPEGYLNTLKGRDRRLMDEVLRQAELRPDGKLAFSARKVARKISGGFDDDHDEYRRVRRLARRAERIAQVLLKARNAASPEEQAQAFQKVMSGKGASGLAYEEIMKVLVQLADPLDISAEFTIHMNILLESGPRHRRANMIALGTFILTPAAFLVPVFGGFVIDTLGHRPVFLLAALASLPGLWLLAKLATRK